MKLAIIGGGAAGVSLVSFIACQVGDEKLPEIDLFEASDRTLRKVRASGNGRCNFTNRNMGPGFYTGSEKDFVKQGLDTFSFEQACEFFRKMGLPYRTLESGMTYPSTMKAESLCLVLEAGMKYSGCRLHTESEIVGLSKNPDGFFLKEKSKGQERPKVYGPFDAVVLASGGAYGIGEKERSCGYSLAKSLGHSISSLHAGIVGVKAEEKDFCRKLSGIKIVAGLSYGSKYIEDDILFTDYGLSGMAVFRASNEILDEVKDKNNYKIHLDLMPHISENDLFVELGLLMAKRKNWMIEDCLRGYLHKEIVVETLKKIGLDPKSEVAGIDKSEIKAWIKQIKSMEFTVTGTRNKDKGQVTCGGISCTDVDPSSLESKLCENLYFAGEILNVQGTCGGYNLHWAWTSAKLIADSIKSKLEN